MVGIPSGADGSSEEVRTATSELRTSVIAPHRIDRYTLPAPDFTAASHRERIPSHVHDKA
jgi:hypothetical protein